MTGQTLPHTVSNRHLTTVKRKSMRNALVPRAEKGRAVNGPMCDAEKDWHERSFRASGAINGCQKSPLGKPKMPFSFFIFKLPVTSF